MEAFYYKDPDYVLLWVHILFKANWKDNHILYKGKKLPIKRGQFITSRNSLVKETGINRSKVERILKTFEIEQQIEQQNFFAFRLITVLNYNERQSVSSKTSSERAASEQPVSTTNKDKKDKKDKKKEPKSIVPTMQGQRSGPPKITFNWTLLEFENITPDHHRVWEKAFPAVDIKIELRKYITWLLANKRKAKTTYMRSLNYWFGQVQDRGGTRGSRQAAGGEIEATWIKDYEKKQKEKP